MKIVPLTKGFVCLVDDCDFEKVSDHKWCINDTNRSLYAIAKFGDKTVYMHRFILDASPGVFVDHINGTHVDNILDNQRQNLRTVSGSLNARNRNLVSPTTSSGGLIGVHCDRRGTHWLARAMVNSKQITVGFFKDKTEAFQALEKWKLESGFRDREFDRRDAFLNPTNKDL